MTFPGLIFGIILSTAYGSAFHFWRGGNMAKLLLYIILAWVGFWGGHIMGGLVGWKFIAIGPINTGMATIGSILFLFAGQWLSQVEVMRK